MALIVMLHHYLAGTFGLSMTIVEDDLIVDFQFVDLRFSVCLI